MPISRDRRCRRTMVATHASRIARFEIGEQRHAKDLTKRYLLVTSSIAPKQAQQGWGIFHWKSWAIFHRRTTSMLSTDPYIPLTVVLRPSVSPARFLCLQRETATAARRCGSPTPHSVEALRSKRWVFRCGSTMFALSLRFPLLLLDLGVVR
jgi:hypothetical protein